MICKKEKCTGCFACYNICPKNAIKMEEDIYGYIYPQIDRQKCIECGACQKICPQCNEEIRFKEPLEAFAAYSNDEEIREKSTSGGVATVFYKKIIENGGVGFGLANIKNNKFCFMKVDTIEKISDVKGSKYVHGYIERTYKEIEEELKKRKVLFIGTPCQVAGLKAFLRKNYENLITVDLICHGVPSQKLLLEEFKRLNLKVDNIDRVSFRSEKGYFLKCYQKKNIILDIPMDKSYYYKGFMDALFMRENCYNCIFSRPERVSDITIGDFWGLDTEAKINISPEKGISVVLPITDKGNDFWNECKYDFNYEKREIQEAVNGNTQLEKTVIKNKNYNKFRKYYIKYGFEKSYNKCMSIKQRMKNNSFIYNTYKKLKELRNEQ